MSFYWCDNIHTTVFTPRDYQVELLASAFERNTIICLGHKSSKEFIALKLIQELAARPESLGKVCLYLTCNGAPSISTMLQHLTDMSVCVEKNDANIMESLRLQQHVVYILTPCQCLAALRAKSIELSDVFLMVLEDCHESEQHLYILPIFHEFYKANEQQNMPKVLGLAGPLHSASCALQELSAMLNALEKRIYSKAETASDIVTVLRYCAKPKEYIVQCAPYETDELTALLRDIINTHKVFLNNHRYDPFEIYNTDEFLEELKDIPDPKKEPMEFLDTMLAVLHEMGPWAADRLAVSMFQRMEKQKIKTPHERHFILLCLVNTALLEIHAICEQTFRHISDHKALVERYSSPKVKRLLEVLRLFKPDDCFSKNESIKQMAQELEATDFQKLSRTLEYKCKAIENLSKTQLETRSILDNLDPLVKEVPNKKRDQDYGQQDYMNAITKPKILNKTEHIQTKRQHQSSHGRFKRRPYARRPQRDNNDISDTLCAIIFCNENHTARVLFDLLAEMSRYDPELKFLKCQFTTDRVADPITEPREAELEHRRQEEVLKRFRMHDCNLLIGTSVLEEGIDVPKCNLVIRWEAPTTYRSYVQCKGRARATHAFHIILVAPRFDIHNYNCGSRERLNERSHSFLCQPPADADCMLDSDSDSDKDTGVGSISPYTFGSSKGIVKILNPEVITTKPPTNTELELKEIKDELQAIEAPKHDEEEEADTQQISTNKIPVNETNGDVLVSSAEEAFNGLTLQTVEHSIDEGALQPLKDESHSAENDLTLKEFEGKDDLNKKDKISKLLDDCYTIISLDEALEILDTSILSNSSSKSTLTSKSSTKCPNSIQNSPVKQPIAVKEKRKFECHMGKLSSSNKDTGSLAEYESKFTEMLETTNEIVDQLATYREIEKMLLQKCANREPNDSEHQLADEFNNCVRPYKPLMHLLTGTSVDLSNSIALVNKYCSKLPSDTFTKLTALWRCAKSIRNGIEVYQYTIRLPINSPLKYDIVGLPMSTNILARRMAALQACIELHRSGELDDNLQPIGKEGFRAIETDWENFELEAQDEKIVHENLEPRPGTTKRRQYYYKRIASQFCDCRPVAGVPCYLYLLDLTLQCPIPEEQNTRGRKIYPPEDAQQGFGILTLKKIPKLSAFPIFTRSGEVRVSIELSKQPVILTEAQITSINTFLNYTFTNVLRLQKFLMHFDPDSTENCVFIVPTLKTKLGKVIDWNFLHIIEENSTMMPTPVPDEKRISEPFDANKYKDAVVMPWYRNQDQPQYFYVAEICPQLSPLSCFPGDNYNTFKHYYFLKYGLTIQNVTQPLLDVDHTSARLNFLTPRYVNRKGVALPTSSEETKRAKRENLEQKQILVPELCTVHPFPASLWRTAVCLPCILYRINGLLLADDIRRKVSADIGLGQQDVGDDFEWPMLDFGWSLSEVLRKSRENKKNLSNDATEHLDKKQQENEKNLGKENGINESESEELPKSANEIVIEGEKQLQESSFIEIGTWSNDMANNINGNDTNENDDDEFNYLPSNVSFCDRQTRYGSPTFWDIKQHNKAKTNTAKTQTSLGGNKAQTTNAMPTTYSYYDSDDSFASSYDDNNGYNSDNGSNIDEDYDDEAAAGRIAFTSKNEAETFETEADIEKRNKQLSIIQATNANELNYQQTKNLQVGYNFEELKDEICEQLGTSIEQFARSTAALKEHIRSSGMLVKFNESVQLPKKLTALTNTRLNVDIESYLKMLPYAEREEIITMLAKATNADCKALSFDELCAINAKYVQEHKDELFTIVGCGDTFDNFNDHDNLKLATTNQDKKLIKLNFEKPQEFKTVSDKYVLTTPNHANPHGTFSFDKQPDLTGHPGPSPSIILQGLTMSNANDGINLERLETIGDSFLKYAITTYLYITYENVHEGKLSHLRSKQVANLNLYRLGRRKLLGEYMIATKFEPHDNWLPPCYYVPKELEKAYIEAKIPPHHWKLVDLPNIKKLSSSEICQLVREKAEALGLLNDEYNYEEDDNGLDDPTEGGNDFSCFIPYNLVTQHSIPDKSVADCVEALIGAYLIECGARGALLFMAWLGIRVLPFHYQPYVPNQPRIPGSTAPDDNQMITVYGSWTPPKSPLLYYSPNAEQELDVMLQGFSEFESILGYKFRDRSYLLQAMTHASYSPNRLTDCYQRLEFLGDAVLDYLITRHLYEDPRQHSPGALTDLRSALVNNTIFASLAVRHGFHKYFRHLSPGLNEVIDRFVRIQNENGHSISEEYYLSEEDCDDAEDVEVPKALGDVFESIAGAIFLDSNMSLDVVWQVYSNMMKPEIEQFSNSVPKSPIRELLELEPETAKFGKPEKLADGRRVRVTVEVFCKGIFRGIGRNYRIAKCTAAKCALRQLKKQGLINKKD